MRYIEHTQHTHQVNYSDVIDYDTESIIRVCKVANKTLNHIGSVLGDLLCAFM